MTRAKPSFVRSLGATAPADIEYAVLGSGLPVTLFAHGLGGGADDTRPLASGLSGTRVFAHARSHGQTTVAAPGITYDDLAIDLITVADKVQATRVLGVSLGAATLVRVLARQPRRFDAVAFYLPPVMAGAKLASEISEMILGGGEPDLKLLTALVLKEVPESVRHSPQVIRWAQTRARRLTKPGIGELLTVVLGSPPVASAAELTGVTSDVTIIGSEGDSAHPAEVSRELAAALRQATVEVFDQPGPLWNHRAGVRELIIAGLAPR